MSELDRLQSRHIRIILCAIIMVFFFLLLSFRLWQVQVVQGVRHRQATLRQSIRPVLLNPARGRIISADGRVLADSISEYDLVAHVSEMRQPGRPSNTINHILACERLMAMTIGRPSVLSEKAVSRHLYQHPVMPLEFCHDLNVVELAKIVEMAPPLAGLEIVPRIERRYELPGIATHVLGFTGKKLPETRNLEEEFSRVYVSPELAGRSGLEAWYNEALSGKIGARLVKVDSQGYAHEDVRKAILPGNGHDLMLSIDSNAQIAADAVLQGHSGALVAVAVHSGAILAMASSPTYNIAGLTQRAFCSLARDKAGFPLLNRAVNGTYTPGSIVKPLIALAALEKGTLDPDELYNCVGRYMVGDHAIRCAKRSGHGLLNLKQAITFSCNPYFMAAGCKTGIDELSPFFAAAGFGEKTGLDLYESVTGILPRREYIEKNWGRNWLTVDTAYVSIGQGAFTISPLQAALYAAALANGGILFKPYLVAKIVSEQGEVLRQTAPVIRHRFPVSVKNLALVQEAMESAVATHGGSASGLQEAGLALAAKTGTAEVGSGENRHKNTWVICYGPLESPEYAVACLIEEGESGGKTAVPIVAFFLRRWLEALESQP
ncbi:MAG: penicillin-binding protein 2 [Lentisphaeria bacterium]